MTSFAQTPDSNRDGGFALFAVLSFMLIAAAVATPFLTGAKTRALIARNLASDLKDRLAVRGLITIAALRFIESARLSDPDVPRRVSCDFGKASAEFLFQNHAGLIDLNMASAELLALGFEALGRTAGDAEKLAQAVVEFRNVAPDRSANAVVSVQGGYKHLQFESVSELQDFEDPAAQGFRGAALVFTVHNGTGTIHSDDATDALRAVIRALPASSASFVVQGNTAATAVTAQVLVRRDDSPSVAGEAIVRSREAAGGLTFLSPIKVRAGEGDSGAAGAAGSCENFFGAELFPAVAKLAAG